MKNKLIAGLALACLATVNLQLATLFAQGTAFTYQGRLNDGGGQANGSYDFTFSLWNAASGPAQVGGTVATAATAVSNGVFTATLDFGNQVPGADRWLEIGVRTNGGGAFTTLAPRQPITSTPYAITAGNLTGALPAAQLSGTVANGQLANNSITVTAGTGLGGGGTVSLGGSTTLSNAGVLSVAGDADITANLSSGVVTLGSSATNANTANRIVKRDGNGDFSAGKITLGSTLDLPATTSATTGIINSGDVPLIHTYGSGNFFAGPLAGNFTMSGTDNVGVGIFALANDTSGSGNTALGGSALIQNQVGGLNTAVGCVALLANVDGHHNTGLGFAALYSHTTGSYNTAIGANTLYPTTSGSFNIALGYGAGNGLANGDHNIYIGNSGSPFDSSTIRIGTSGFQTNTVIAGVISGDGGGLTNVPAGAITGGLTMNLAVLVPGGFTNILSFTNGILRAIQ